MPRFRPTPYDTSFYRETTERALASARIVAPVIMELLSPRSIIDFGCGEGAWLSTFRALGVEACLGLDGPKSSLERLLIDPSCFRVVDLERDRSFHGRFDLAISLEVAEHLSKRAGRSLVAALTEAADISIFSAAAPGQGGTSHVNEQFLDYWIQQFGRKGFRAMDLLRPRFAFDHGVAWWYRQNLMVFVARDRWDEVVAKTGYAGSDAPSQEWIHANTLAGLSRCSVLLSRLPAAALRSILAAGKRTWARLQRPGGDGVAR